MLLSRVALSNIRIAHLAKTISFSLTTGRKKFKCPQAISFCTERHQNSPFSKIYFFFPYNWKDQIHMSLVTLCFTEQHQNSPYSKNYFFFPYNWKEQIHMSLVTLCCIEQHQNSPFSNNFFLFFSYSWRERLLMCQHQLFPGGRIRS